MTDHFHDIRDLISGNDTSSFALRADLSRHAVLIGFEDRSLVKTYSRGVDVHIAEYNVRVTDSSW